MLDDDKGTAMHPHITPFTPEYSNELLRRVQDLYHEDIKHYYPQLKLEKLLDLLEHTEYLFELYLDSIHHDRPNDALTAFIIGCYYVFLIIPQSLQFQTRNKSYSIYTDLKKMYENEMNMTNVVLMVKKEIGVVLDESVKHGAGIEHRITKKRAFSVPADDLSGQVASLSLDTAAPQDHDLKGTFTEDDAEQSSPVWTAPNLEPNDQLKLALLPEVISTPAFREPERKTSVPVRPSVLLEDVPSIYHEDDTSFASLNPPFREITADRSVTHRKDSYHSVYMVDSGNLKEDNDDLFNVENDGFIQSLDILQKQSIITAPELFSILSNRVEREKVLLIDLRIPQRSAINHIVAPNLVNVDPNLLWDKQTNTPIYKDDILEHLLEENENFINRNKFDYIVYYTDVKTFMTINFDYAFIFFYLMLTSQKTPLTTVPTTLLGGYEKWKKTLHSYAQEYHISIEDYLYRPYSQKARLQQEQQQQQQQQQQPDSQDSSSAKESSTKVPESPSWKPPDLPIRLRKRPPPPPPVSMPTTPEIPPPLPPKIMVHSQVSSISRKPPIPAKQHVKKEQLNSNEIIQRKRQHQHQHYDQQILQPQRAYNIPTIERSPNVYVSLSITGLRNLGNTCYINSMIQCLFAAKTFRTLFISSKYKSYLQPIRSNGSHYSPKLSNSLSMLFNKMYLNGGCSVVPTGFLKVINQLRPDLKIPDDQQDTQEFLMILLDRLHDELSDQQHVANDYPNLLLYNADALKVSNNEYKHWFDKNVIGNGISPIDDIFQGQMENSLQCKRCGYTTFNYSTFYVLSLAIPRRSMKLSKLGRSTEKRVKLEDCINMFTSDEVLSGENAWDCPRCGPTASVSTSVSALENEPSIVKSKKKKSRFFTLHTGTKRRHLDFFGDGITEGHNSNNNNTTIFERERSRSPFRMLGGSGKRSSSSTPFSTGGNDSNNSSDYKNKKLTTVKTINFVTLPKILVIHLSRFYYDLTKKNNTVVTYPLILNIILKNNDTMKYKLFGVVNHTGTLISGHYTSLVNKDLEHNVNIGRSKWYYFDDEVVKADRKHGSDKNLKISSSDVYVLFYERVYD
ncbi:BAF_HP2_G0025510.mRNA.1.CDS.1 [Saccharomyces cerevisiae]|nr:BAF_HP2_G0025510.mRNA.1.CDS.1 [Saccharomyces cerevisiae]CAI6452229.1 BAF_HP1_G0025830.mRNA.1.CDS.1 [Saccharomyces cerevisiae]CAI6459770.1 BAF_HP2_G0025510.mRNA.1.CDS.1 [Saccharomyces cerevisiae]